MLLTYVDESYNREVYYIAALLCPDQEAISLTRALDAVVARAANLHGVAPNAELHGHDLFQAKGAWEHLAKMPRVRIGVYNEAFQAIGDHDVKIIIRGVNSRRLRERYNATDDPHSVVLGQLLERVDEYVARRGEYALVIADEVAQPGLYRADLSLYQQHGLWGESTRRLTRIVDTLHFAPSSASRLVQAADLIAFLHRRIETETAPDDRARRANSAIWARVGPRVQHSTCWTP
ncbi:DUF3800 domain-containing protein [Micromonospora sp. NPDC050980]|uniref:DUF3800 domain-containing protein n=1 Tax=Micromonospora sp. NPDC050980 TaxID=3155161 RepID=UPI0033D5EF63